MDNDIFSEKIIRELPHEPPVLRKDQMNQFVERLNLRLPLNQTEPENVVKKAFAFGFKQPMSNYIAFKVSFKWPLVIKYRYTDGARSDLRIFEPSGTICSLHTPKTSDYVLTLSNSMTCFSLD